LGNLKRFTPEKIRWPGGLKRFYSQELKFMARRRIYGNFFFNVGLN